MSALRARRLFRPVSTAAIATATSVALAFGGVVAPIEAKAQALAQASPTYRTMLGIGPDESSATLSWRSTHKGPEMVRVSRVDNPSAVRDFAAWDVDAGADLYDSKHATITGLAPSTWYTYQIGSDAGGWSRAYEFATDDGDGHWNFLAFADAQIGVDMRIDSNGQGWRDATNKATTMYPDASFLMHLGDQVEGWGDPIAQYAQFFSPWQVRHYKTGVLYGNHEDYQLGKRHFDEHYNLPNEQGNSGNYFFEHNNVLFIGINSMASSPADVARHQQYIRDVVRDYGGNKDWVLAGLHHAPFSQGSHTHDTDVQAMRDGLAPVFSETGVDLVLSGHDHIYTRSHLMRGTAAQVPERPAAIGDRLVPAEGEVLYVTSTTSSGSKYYDFHDQAGGDHPGIARAHTVGTGLELPTTAYWQQDYTPDFSRVSISPTEITVTTHNVYSDELVDEVTIAKQGQRTPKIVGDAIAAAPADPNDPWTILANHGYSQEILLGMLARVLQNMMNAVGLVMPHYRSMTDALGIRF